MQRFFLLFASLLRKHQWSVIVLLVGLTTACAFSALMSQVDNSLAVWQSSDDPHWHQYQAFVARYKIIDPLIVYLPGLELLDLDDLADAMQVALPVDSIQSLSVHGLTGQEAGLFFIFPPAQSTPARLASVLADVKKIIEDQGYPYRLGGVWYLTTLLDQLSATTTRSLFPVVLAILTLGVVVLVRNLRNVLLVLSCGCLPAVQITGIMAFCGVKLNMILLALPPCTMILGIAHAIHLVSKEPSTGQPDGLRLYGEVAWPSLLSGLTIMIGFFSLVLSDYMPIVQLGIWGTVAGGLSLINSLLVLGLFFEPAPSRVLRLPAGYVAFMDRHRTRLALVFLSLTLLTGGGFFRLETGSLILDFFQKTATIRQDYTRIEAAGLGLTPFEVDLAQSQLCSEALKELFTRYSQQNPLVTQVIYTFADGATKIEATPQGISFPSFLALGTEKQRPQRATVLLKTVGSEQTLDMAEELEQLLQQGIGPQDHPYVTGSVPLYCRGQRQLFTTLLSSFAGAFIPISLVMGVALRSWYYALLAIIPNVLPVFLILALMGWLGLPLSVATVTVASIVFGIVVDDTIHFLHRLKTATARSEKAVVHLSETIHYAGPAMLTAAVISGIGFLGFIVAPFIPLRHFGLLISGALWLAILCDLVVLPLLLLLWKR